MNAINRFTTSLFDVVLVPLEAMGMEIAIILVSGIFGVLGLLVFKQISSQKGIKATKDKIKGHMIEIRIYQDDLTLVTKAIGKVLGRNLQYVCLNFGPFIPLSIPFVFVLAQMVTRYGYDAAPVIEQPSELLAGEGTTLTIHFKEGSLAAAGELEIEFPDGLVPTSPLVRIPGQGLAVQEFAAIRGGQFEIKLTAGGVTEIKRYDAGAEGQEARYRQGQRIAGFWSVLYPMEDAFVSASPFEEISFVYPPSQLGWLPMEGEAGVLVAFIVASMLFGIAALKPLGVTI